MWYECKKTLTHNCLFNFIIGNRGGGKTFSCKKWCVDDYLKNKNEFIYIRRYETELKGNSNFFKPLQKEGLYKDVELSVKGNKYMINGKVCGYSFPLSKAITIKSNDFPNVTKIIFDEFIIDKGSYHYLSNEVEMFLEFYESVARMRDVRVFFLANAITQINPYFLYFGLQLPYNSKIVKKNDMLLQMVEDTHYIEAKKSTRFGKMLQGTNYEQYAIENKFLRDKTNMLGKKGKNARYYFTLVFNSEKYGVWLDRVEGLFYLSYDIDPCHEYVYSITLDDHTENTILIKNINKSAMLKMFIDFYKVGKVRFENIKLRNIAFDIIRTLLK